MTCGKCVILTPSSVLTPLPLPPVPPPPPLQSPPLLLQRRVGLESPEVAAVVELTGFLLFFKKINI